MTKPTPEEIGRVITAAHTLAGHDEHPIGYFDPESAFANGVAIALQWALGTYDLDPLHGIRGLDERD